MLLPTFMNAPSIETNLSLKLHISLFRPPTLHPTITPFHQKNVHGLFRFSILFSKKKVFTNFHERTKYFAQTNLYVAFKPQILLLPPPPATTPFHQKICNGPFEIFILMVQENCLSLINGPIIISFLQTRLTLKRKTIRSDPLVHPSDRLSIYLSVCLIVWLLFRIELV